MEKKRSRESHDTKLSRGLSRVLRHSAVRDGVPIRPDGFVKLTDLKALKQFSTYTLEQFQAVVAENDKKRFAMVLEDNVWWIRANQGHSMPIVETEKLMEKVDLTTIKECIHGTYNDAWNAIKTTGLKRMKRNHIHFAEGLPGENGVISGMRKSAQILIYLNTTACKLANLPMYRSANGVLLSQGFQIGDQEGVIPSCLFEKVIDRSSKEIIFQGDASLAKTDWPPAKITVDSVAPARKPPKKDKNENRKIKGMLLKVLKHTAVKDGFTISEDGSILLSDLRNTLPEINAFSPQDFQKMIDDLGDLVTLSCSPEDPKCQIRATSGHTFFTKPAEAKKS